MKSFHYLASFVALAVAIPTDLGPRADCPTIDQIAPTGQLPPGTLSPAFLQTVSKKEPNKAFPASQSAIVTPNDKCTITQFDIPASAQNKTCSLVLTLGDCGGNAYEKGPGNIIFQGLTGTSFPVPGQTTYANQPPLADPFPDSPVITLGNAYRLGGGPCDYRPGQAFTSVGGSICSTDTTLSFTESYGGNGKCPIGFHIIIT
ncbi:hypothetical protein IAQ61_010091 [Plenodomus lingam]|uniref:Ubiquitin 3 binding protein But2 C-terminal domain-containing protein n=1 Tax=Leptosphaeria maculans (strain JN3 / isolate v23.1.3 / race Av1-4-5-6-7-8) TaxID=985895 RepID=E5A3W4_LEPMJ|nr:hypothetical protein LEMA_P093970.1 [Plenodomus lingam JN3]KAH9861890.1 hypothetical protein IAQ61_010091 [Plenodomus lingam]CBX97988.1 hypothetical protein LEMA_P093970.1 [Plenodomus lingam JN3]